jgi:aspartyl-tRNA(Asn)/glutamyl-tRNA(Gln) amidotransferase subunit C
MIKKEEVGKIAKLARVGITGQEEELFRKNLSGILEHFNYLKKAGTKKIDPTFHANEDFLDNEQKMRQDVVLAPDATEKIREAFPSKKENYIKVKAIL